ncbi:MULTISPECIES: hypothetical protein [unclassified Streptomyces]|uniref:hypothetical protein n=1 Tax=unclassified Streptomyces TaxID=2593676 RepID=UPI003869533D
MGAGTFGAGRRGGGAVAGGQRAACAWGGRSAAGGGHFKTEQALLDALALTGFERLAEAIAASGEGVGESFAERLSAVARAYVGFATANAALLDLMYSVKHGPEASEALRATAHRSEVFGVDRLWPGPLNAFYLIQTGSLV